MQSKERYVNYSLITSNDCENNTYAPINNTKNPIIVSPYTGQQ